jgi:alkylation response protein AidB-like acyl-CoA dehydrogenase
MRTPGVEVRPLRQMSGGYHFNEVFLDEVFVPSPALIGKPGGGWAVLRTMLASERAAIGGGTSGRAAVHLVALARRLRRTDDPVVRQLLASAYIRERVLDLLQARVIGGSGVPAGGSVTKLLYSEHARRSASDAMQLLGAAGMTNDHPDAAPWAERLLFAPGLRLGGGTDEIQRNTIAERGLGLPREGTR